MTAPGTSYDEVPYESHTHAQTQPDRLATLARLFSLETALPSRARVLEIGCAAGRNLIPLASRYPQARFTGIDLSRKQVDEGKKHIAALGLTNVTLLAMDLMQVDASLGEFDYIVAHGVYSWIPPEARKKLLAVCSANLSALGVAYVSYNTNPGWRLRGVIRDMMRYHVARFKEPLQRVAQARALLAFLQTSLAEETSAYATLLREESRTLAEMPDYYLLHEQLEEHNEPVYFHEFLAQTAAAGLQYLCEEEIAASVPELSFKPDVLATLQRISADMANLEQYADFLRNRSFRQSLLIGAVRVPQRTIDLKAVGGMYAESRARPISAQPDLQSQAKESYVIENGSAIATPHPVTKAAFEILGRCWPRALPMQELYMQVQARLGGGAAAPVAPVAPEQPGFKLLADDMARAFSIKVVGLHCEAPQVTDVVSARPVAFAPARYFASLREGRLPNTRHETLTWDSFAVLLLSLLDGSRDLAALVEEMIAFAAAGRMSLEENGQPLTDPLKVRQYLDASVRHTLGQLRDRAYLVA